MQLTLSLRRLAKILVIVMIVLAVAGFWAEYARYVAKAESPLIRFFSLTQEQNVPTWWSSVLLLACSAVLFSIVATKSRGGGQYRPHWIGLALIFMYMSIDELVEIHEYLSWVPGLGNLHGAIFYGWVIPATGLVLIFALSYLGFLFHLPKNTRFKVAAAGVIYVGGAVGIELVLGAWSDKHGEYNFMWSMIGLVEEALEIAGSSLFLYSLLEYLGQSVPELRVAIQAVPDRKEVEAMTAPPAKVPSWVLSPWVKWSWLLVLIVIVGQSLSYQWRILPTTAAGYSSRGRNDYLNGEYETAIANFSKAIEAQPDESEWYIWRGSSYLKQLELAKATADLEKAVQLSPQYSKAMAARADGKAAAWDASGAIEGYTKALEIDPDYSRCYMERGMAYYDSGMWDQAVADLRQSVTHLSDYDLLTSYFVLWLAEAHNGSAYGASTALSKVMIPGKIRGDRFWLSAQFLCGQITEATYLDAMPKLKDGSPAELTAESSFLAGVRRLVFGDRKGAMHLLQAALATEADNFYAYERARVELESLLLGFHAKWTVQTDPELVVASVAPGGPADTAGIRPGWRLTAINENGASQEAIFEFLTSVEAGSTAELQFVNGEGAKVTVPLLITPETSEPTK